MCPYNRFIRNQPMSTTFADYTSQTEARKNIAEVVLGHTYALCEALRQNYIDYSIKYHQRQLIEYGGDRCDVSYAPYHEEQIAKLKDGICDYEFVIETGRKYHKIIMLIHNTASSTGTSRSVHAFIDKKTGEVYKSASFKAPAKGVRYDLRLIEQREWLLENADWSGAYLYAK